MLERTIAAEMTHIDRTRMNLLKNRKFHPHGAGIYASQLNFVSAEIGPLRSKRRLLQQHKLQNCLAAH
jgi:hypothetical protein